MHIYYIGKGGSFFSQPELSDLQQMNWNPAIDLSGKFYVHNISVINRMACNLKMTVLLRNKNTKTEVESTNAQT